jgi:hypothetical protein
VHIEQMTDRQWWMRIGNEVFWLTSHTPTELAHSGRVTVRQDQESWNLGYEDARAGRQWRPVGVDRLAYASGYVEGRAARAKAGG